MELGVSEAAGFAVEPPTVRPSLESLFPTLLFFGAGGCWRGRFAGRGGRSDGDEIPASSHRPRKSATIFSRCPLGSYWRKASLMAVSLSSAGLTMVNTGR